MKSNKALKYTGIIQGVLIATLLLLAISIQVVFMYNTYTIVKIILLIFLEIWALVIGIYGIILQRFSS